MNLGFRDAGLLGRSFAAALESRSRDPLEAYASTQRSAAEHVLAMTHRLTRVATLRNRAGSRVRNRILSSASLLPPVRRKLARALAGVA
jgi:2-polyprenyl-6-methoxyphenol hydroxylase-like FAD-dependent oxidoreductase